MRTALAAVAKGDLPNLCLKANAGSSWAALIVAINTKPDSLAELMRVVGVSISGKYRERAFDACADAWSVYQDGRDHGELPT